MYRELVPDSAARKAAGAAAIVAGVPGAREVALRDLGSGSEANAPMMPDIYGNQDIDPNSPGPAQITDPNAPINIASQRESTPEMGMERQEAIANQGRGARYDENSIMGLLSSLVGNPKANEAFDSTKPIGGENVPYKPSGFFRSFLGDPANRKNIEAQLAQGAEWKAETARTKQRAERKQDLEDEIALREKGPNARFAAEQKRLDDKAIQDEIERNNAIDLGLVREGNEAVLKDEDMVRKALSDEQEGRRKDRELDIRESAIKPPRYSPIGNTGMFQTPEGDLAVFEPEVMRISDKMPGRPAKFRMLTGEGSKPPGRTDGDIEVDRLTNKPIVKTPPPAPAPENTAIVPRFMRGAGEVVGEGVQSFMDPLRSGATGLNQLLFNSGAQQDPEVLKRMEERARRNPLRNPSIATPMGY